MEPYEQKIALLLFTEQLPGTAKIALLDKNVDIFLNVSELGGTNGFTGGEMGNLFEGVKRVLAGEEPLTRFQTFVESDTRIEDDNRSKIPALVEAVTKQVLMPALPIMKAAGYAVTIPTSAPVPTALGAAAAPAAARPPLEEKNMRALLRIAAGTRYTEGELRAAFEGLPPGLRQSLSSVDTANAVQSIAKKYFLHVDQMAVLASETGLVLLGLTHPADFIKNLAVRLRLPEDKVKDIARDVSTQVLSKVREALRTLHESSESPKSKFPISKPTQGVVPAKAGNQTILDSRLRGNDNAETLKKIEVMPQVQIQDSRFKIQESKTPPIPAAPLPKTSTPFSPSAKWNTGENVLAKQAEEKLSREEVLRGIENPRAIAQPPTSNQQPTTPAASPLNANRYPPTGGLSASPVGPTGWQPPAGVSSQVTLPKYPINKLEPVPPAPPKSASGQPIMKPPMPASAPSAPPRPAPPKPPTPPARTTFGPQNLSGQSPSASFSKAKPSDQAAVSPPPEPALEPQDFLDQKLQAPMGLPKEEKRYTTDPYREPFE